LKIKQGSWDNPEDPRKHKWYQLNPSKSEPDMDVDVVLVFVVREMGESCGIDRGKELLMVRRSPTDVAAMTSLWSPVAGVDDKVLSEDQDRAGIVTVLEELRDEVGIVVTEWDADLLVTNFGSNDHPCGALEGRTWHQSLYSLPFNTRLITLNDENCGKIWVPFSAIKGYMETGKTEDPSLSLVLRDGTVFTEDGNLDRFWDWAKTL